MGRLKILFMCIQDFPFSVSKKYEQYNCFLRYVTDMIFKWALIELSVDTWNLIYMSMITIYYKEWSVHS